MASQWERLLKNQGTWEGSFTQLSPTGEVLSDVPSQIRLIPTQQGEAMRQEIHKFPPGKPPQETVLEYRSLNRATLFQPDGAFSQGSIQWGPLSDFGAELGMIWGDERLRLVLLYLKGARDLSEIVLIREHRADTKPSDRSPLSPDQLVGTWEGEAVTAYPDYRLEDRYSTRLTIQRNGNQLQQILSFGDASPIQSQGQIQGNHIRFSQGQHPVQISLLPSGASATYPRPIAPRQPMFLEAGWLIQPDLRQRLIRTYDSQGSWVSLTLVTERKISP